MRYNERIQEYDTARRQFPANITAKVFGFKEYQQYGKNRTKQQENIAVLLSSRSRTQPRCCMSRAEFAHRD